MVSGFRMSLLSNRTKSKKNIKGTNKQAEPVFALLQPRHRNKEASQNLVANKRRDTVVNKGNALLTVNHAIDLPPKSVADFGRNNHCQFIQNIVCTLLTYYRQ